MRSKPSSKDWRSSSIFTAPLERFSLSSLQSNERIDISLSRRSQVASLREFAIQARRELSGLPDRLRMTVQAVSEAQRLDDKLLIEKLKKEVENLTTELASCRSSKAILADEVIALKKGLRVALEKLKGSAQYVRNEEDSEDSVIEYIQASPEEQ